MKVFVTGGTGFTGSHVIPLLLQNGYQVCCLHRLTSDRSVLPDPEIEWAEGDLSDPQGLSAAMRGTDILVNIASLGLGYVDSTLQAARSAGLQRAVFVSTTAIFTALNAKSKNIRRAAEQSIQSSGLQYTILRPTMIYGSPRDRNMWRLIRFMRVSPVIPVFGDGNSFQQPIHVEDVARAIVGCLPRSQTIGKSYNIAGKYPLTYNDVIDTIARQLGKRVWKLHIPSGPAASLLGLLERWHIPLPVRSEQVRRLNEDKKFSYETAQMDFGFQPLSFEQGMAKEINP